MLSPRYLEGVMAAPGLQQAYESVTETTNAELEYTCEEFRIRANEVEKRATSVMAAKG